MQRTCLVFGRLCSRNAARAVKLDVYLQYNGHFYYCA